MSEAIDNYVPYGPAWEKEMMKMPKAFIINMFRKIKLENQWKTFSNDCKPEEGQRFAIKDNEEDGLYIRHENSDLFISSIGMKLSEGQAISARLQWYPIP